MSCISRGSGAVTAMVDLPTLELRLAVDQGCQALVDSSGGHGVTSFLRCCPARIACFHSDIASSLALVQCCDPRFCSASARLCSIIRAWLRGLAVRAVCMATCC